MKAKRKISQIVSKIEEIAIESEKLSIEKSEELLGGYMVYGCGDPNNVCSVTPRDAGCAKFN